MDENRLMSIIDENGNEQQAYIIFTTNLEQFNKNYVFFFIPGSDDMNVSVASFTQDGENGQLNAVESDDEYKALEEVYSQFVEENQDYIDSLAEGNFDAAEGGCGSCGGCGGCNGNCGSSEDGSCSCCGGECDCSKKN